LDMVSLRTMTSMIAENAKPRLRPQKIYQNMVNDSQSPSPTAPTSCVMFMAEGSLGIE
jgi:hypothetical protein